MINFDNMLQQAKELQTKIAEMDKEIENWQETGVAGGDEVAITLNGKGVVVDVVINPSLLNPEQKNILEDLIKAASNNAKEKIQNRLEKYKSDMFANIPMPPGFKLPF
ncbi:MAG: YbaB/EbfC family nucleoid-associated protein [Alphaproteobacteria bacterium]